MYTSEEQKIIERCLSIAIWNHRAGKSAVAGKAIEASAFKSRVLLELGVLKVVILKGQRSTSDVSTSQAAPPSNRRISKFFSKLVGIGGFK